jgi:EmrB/QacA subfamily drug resistance transporter
VAESAGRGTDRRAIYVVFSGLVLVMLMAALDSTIVSTALPTIVGDLGGLNHISWVVTAYLLAQTAVTPLYGKLGDLYGRKVVLQVAMVVFLAGSALCAAAQNLDMLIAFRAIQGLGGGGLIVSAQAAVGDVVPPRERGRYQGIFGAVFGLASVLGPLLGGFFTSSLSWRWIFYVNLPVGVLAFVVIQATFKSRADRVHHQIDYFGAGLLAAALSALVLMCTLGGTSYKWLSGVPIGLGIAAIVLTVVFVRAERRAAEPVLPPRLFANRVFAVTSGVGLIVGFALFGSVTYLPLFLQVVNGASPTGSGLQILPLMAGLLITSIGSGQIITRTGRYKVFPIIGTAVMTVGMVLLSTMSATTSGALASVFMFVLGLGLGSVMQVLVLAVQNAVDYQDLGVATSGATAILGSIFSSRLSSNLKSSVGSAAGRSGVSGLAHANPAALKKLPAPIHHAYIHAFTNSLDLIFAVAAGVVGVAFLLSWLVPQRQLRDTVAAASGLGESFALPKHTDSQAEIARALTALVGREGRRRFAEGMVERAGVEMPAAAAWLLVRLHETPGADLGELGERYEIPPEVVDGALDELVARGFVMLATDPDAPPRTVSPEGDRLVERLVSERQRTLERLLDGWSPERHADLAKLLSRLARELVRDPADHGPVMDAAGGGVGTG